MAMGNECIEKSPDRPSVETEIKAGAQVAAVLSVLVSCDAKPEVHLL